MEFNGIPELIFATKNENGIIYYLKGKIDQCSAFLFHTVLDLFGWVKSANLDVCLHTAAVTVNNQVGELEVTRHLLLHSNLQAHALAQSYISVNLKYKNN